VSTNHVSKVNAGGRYIGGNEPTFVIAEIGINHNGSLTIAKQLINAAAKAGCDAVKFQKRTPELCVPPEIWHSIRETPWGSMSYIDYRNKMEFWAEDFAQIDTYCVQQGIRWFASCWDECSVSFIQQFDAVMYKAPSSLLTNISLLQTMKETGKPLMISTGMSTMEQIEHAVDVVGEDGLLIAHSTSIYPCSDSQLNLNMIPVLQRKFPRAVVGYSGHETGLPTTVAAVAVGAAFIERHITLDRAMWGSDQAASVEPHGLEILVRHIRSVEQARGDGIKQVYPEEMVAMKKLRPQAVPA